MKKRIQAVLQRLLGFDRYLLVFGLFTLLRLRWDRREGDFVYFVRSLSTDAQVLDIGANIGVMTAWLARHCRQGRVYAFEPVPENFRALQRLLRLLRLRNVELYPLAVGAKQQQIEIAMPVMRGVRMQGLSHVDHPGIEGYAVEYHRYRVPQVALDSFAPLAEVPVAAIKLDVENYERFVLAGGEELIRRNLPLIYTELWDNENRSVCMKLLTEMGYRATVREGKAWVDFVPGYHKHQNFLFLPPGISSQYSKG
jgi:FkbM family methyltransferase